MKANALLLENSLYNRFQVKMASAQSEGLITIYFCRFSLLRSLWTLVPVFLREHPGVGYGPLEVL